MELRTIASYAYMYQFIIYSLAASVCKFGRDFLCKANLFRQLAVMVLARVTNGDGVWVLGFGVSVEQSFDVYKCQFIRIFSNEN